MKTTINLHGPYTTEVKTINGNGLTVLRIENGEGQVTLFFDSKRKIQEFFCSLDNQFRAHQQED